MDRKLQKQFLLCLNRKGGDKVLKFFRSSKQFSVISLTAVVTNLFLSDDNCVAILTKTQKVI